MSILEKLQNNKGTISSALGKELAWEVLNGDRGILNEAVALCVYNLPDPGSKNVRAGAAKIVEIVAEKKPEWVSPFLNDLFPCLQAPEPQTRWMTIRTFGFCAVLSPETAKKGIEYAKCFLLGNEGVCLSGSAALYLGDIGALSKETARTVLSVLGEAEKKAGKNEIDWILEAYMKIFPMLDENGRSRLASFAGHQLRAEKKSTRARAEKLLKKAGSEKL